MPADAGMNVSELAPLAFAAPLVAAGLIATFGSMWHRRVNDVIAIFAGMLTALIACALLTVVAVNGTIVHWFGGWTPRHGVSIGIAFVVDPIGGALAFFAALLTFAALIFAWTYYDDAGPEFQTLMLVFGSALIGFFLTGDLFNLFVFFELMSVSAYALTGFRCEDESAVMGALSFAVINSIGALFVLIGVAVLYARTGALNFSQLGHALAGLPDSLVIVAFTLISFGFLVKASIVPAHFWLSEAHAVAPTPLCVLFSGIMVQAGIYAVARLYIDVFSTSLGPYSGRIEPVLLGFGIVTALVGAAMCLSQQHLKRLLAFSTVSHSGIMLCALALFSTRALAGLVVYIIGHGLAKGALFMGAGVVLNRWKSLDIYELRGRLRGEKSLIVLFTIGGLALAGLPVFGTFLGKAFIDRASDADGLHWLPLLLVLAAAITGAAVLRAIGTMAFGWGPPAEANPDAATPKTEGAEASESGVPFPMVATAVALLVLCAGMTFAPGRSSTPLAAAQRFADRERKLSVTMDGRPTGPLSKVEPEPLRRGVLLGLCASAVAVVLAGGMLFGYRLRASREAGQTLALVLHPLRAAHDGVVTDYILWLMGGAVVFGYAVSLAMHL